jgi:WD40 repeat protein
LIWDAETGRYTQLVTRLAADSVAFSPDGRSVLSTSKTNGVYLWDAETGEEILHLDTLEVINRAAISPDGRTALLGAEKGTVMLWDLGSGQVLRRFNGHNGHAVQGVAFSPDGEFAFTAGEDGRLVQWRMDTPSLDELLEWIEANRYVRELTCEERAIYSVEPPCE